MGPPVPRRDRLAAASAAAEGLRRQRQISLLGFTWEHPQPNRHQPQVIRGQKPRLNRGTPPSRRAYSLRGSPRLVRCNRTVPPSSPSPSALSSTDGSSTPSRSTCPT